MEPGARAGPHHHQQPEPHRQAPGHWAQGEAALTGCLVNAGTCQCEVCMGAEVQLSQQELFLVTYVHHTSGGQSDGHCGGVGQ